jgi:hypothetical protein
VIIQFCACALIGAAARPGIASRYLPTIESLGRDHPRPALAGDFPMSGYRAGSFE